MFYRLCLLFFLTTATFGCNRSTPFLNGQSSGLPAPASPSGNFLGLFGNAAPNTEVLGLQQRYEARELELNRRLQLLDDNNRQLQTQLAQSQQQIQLSQDERILLRQQLQDVSGQLQQSRFASAQTSQQLNDISQQARSLEASTTRRGGAKLTANSSLKEQSDALKSLGFEVFQDASVLRMRVPADQLFEPNTNKLTSSGAMTVDRIAQVIKTEYPRQRIGIEGHTDAGPFYGGNYSTPQQLSAAQSTTIAEALERRNHLPTNQLFSLAHGTNHLIADNQTPAGRSLNRRIEVVIYPDTF